MKPKVLLAGATGYIGKNLIASIKSEAQLYTLSKYPKEEEVQEVIWLKKDIYNYRDVVDALEGMDIAIYYLDPTKHSAKLTDATAKDLNLIAADNFGRAAAINKVTKIIYIGGSRFDRETVERLSAYGVTVEETENRVERPHVSAELQVSKYDDVRTAMNMQLPVNWSLEHMVKAYMSWLNETKGTIIHSYNEGDNFFIYLKRKDRPLLILHKVQTAEDIITMHLVGGSLTKPNIKKQGKLEFRLLKGSSKVMVHLHDYIPKVIWPIYYVSQAPFQKMMLRGFDVNCRIKNFQERLRSGESMKYTK